MSRKTPPKDPAELLRWLADEVRDLRSQLADANRRITVLEQSQSSTI